VFEQGGEMVSAVGTSSLPAVASTDSGSARGALEAQITQLQKQLADCSTCPSYQNALGKQDIQEISGKLASAQSRLEQIDANQAIRRNPPPQAATAVEPSRVIDAPAAAVSAAATPLEVAASPAADGLRGGVIDTFA
jgi:hypothetical protein